ncbi:hypothetical protein AMK59_8722 [Oryctes borbonicus]|uniref:Uncharacterized protein n=1 Tax=Oryctes borbonicus TaxID=1629725 RepID=A0A0T6AXE9_9SCAR|nr:hypothetical protein AMK59_8722 [Oryctes borbonicus]
MLDDLESELSLALRARTENEALLRNFSYLINDFYDEEPSSGIDPEYEQFLADVWVGIVLTLMVLCCVCCMCSCLLYHKFQQWKRSVEERRREDLEAANAESESLPSYTIVSGLPSYEEALEQLKKVKELSSVSSSSSKDQAAASATGPKVEDSARSLAPSQQLQTISVIELFQLYKNVGQQEGGKL